MQTILPPGQHAARTRWGTHATGAAFDRKKRTHLTGDARDFIAEQTLCVVAGRDERNDPGGLMTFGTPGFVETPDDRTCLLRLDRFLLNARVLRSLLHGAAGEPAVRLGLFFIHHPTRERLCVYGTAEALGSASDDSPDILVRLHLEQVFFHCAKYIRTQVPGLTVPAGETSGPPRLTGGESTHLDETARAFLAEAFLCFVCTVDGEGRCAVNHRNGGRGFLVALPPGDAPGGTVLLPDYAGNGAFEAIGNILETGKAALVVPDYVGQQALCISGAARVLDLSELTPYIARRCPGAGRVVALSVRRVETQIGDWSVPLAHAQDSAARLLASGGLSGGCSLLDRDSEIPQEIDHAAG